MQEFDRQASTGQPFTELHATHRGDRFLAMVGIVYGVGAGIAGYVFAGATTLALWVSGGVFGLAGLIVLIGSLRPTRIAFSDQGLSVKSEGTEFEGTEFEGPWSQVEAITISTIPKQNEDDEERHNLVLYVMPHVKMKRPPAYPIWSEKKGYVLIELSNVRETPQQVAEILRHYAKDKFYTPR
jgi:hypothetical protein